MGRRGVGGRDSSAHATTPRYSGGSMPQRGADPRQQSWETLSSSAPPSPAQPSAMQSSPTQHSSTQPSSTQPPGAPPSRQRSRQGKRKPGHGATYSVVVMTIASLFGVAVLAAQAAATAPQVSNNGAKGAGTASGQPTANASAGSATGGATNPAALPANSGSGARIVYGEGAKRIWLVSASNTVARTMAVVPGTVPAPTGSFTVTNKLSQVTGTDGTPVQYVVLFNKAFGFDAVANVTGMPPAPTSHTGGVRMAQADAQALFNFSSVGTTVVVLP
ncbi:L,D-transpeptidase family protein [Actinocrinis sp.]|uniref:L,D-transpeptidase family protein n=1 Tax=Actinocrinis sp. TaxID=1920516 RepID=UPI002D744F40|nr:L,D-transpeptidase family protein [Actinocrinis sp.]HZP54932.1 L,D-transpeptidase family protein [Actinocrinis sp.]